MPAGCSTFHVVTPVSAEIAHTEPTIFMPGASCGTIRSP
jgi:hypothetical protein